MDCLKPGGIAVHTTLFNFSYSADTFESPDLYLFRRQDIARLRQLLAETGHYMFPIDWNTGKTHPDAYVDYPPYALLHRIKLEIQKCACTSISIIRKAC